jgi:hypothetical protein
MAPTLSKKRAPVDSPQPVVIGAVRYEALAMGKARNLGQNGGLIAATDISTGKELWVLKVYEVHYDASMEQDKQDIFITDLSVAPDGRSLLIGTARGDRYQVDTATRKVTPLSGQ